jgi:molybdopterin synthase catalytic subunit
MIALVDHAIDVAQVEASVRDASCGAVLVFVGTTRDTFDDRPVLRLEYEAYVALAQAELMAIASEIGARWPGARAALVHRLGVVPVTEASVVIAVATPHRADAYDASRYAIEALKARVPIWKKEVYDDGHAWKANAAIHEDPTGT